MFFIETQVSDTGPLGILFYKQQEFAWNLDLEVHVLNPVYSAYSVPYLSYKKKRGKINKREGEGMY